MVRVEDLMAAIQNGQSADDLAAEYAKMLNEANARVKADAEAKAKAIADVEAEYELKQNVKSDQTQRVDKAWKSLASDLLKNK